MADNTKLVTELVGDNSNLLASLQGATKGISDFTKSSSGSFMGMENPLKKVSGLFESFQGVSLGMATGIGAAAAAIGAMVKYGMDAITTTADFGKEMIALHKFMGGSSEQAGELAMALHRVGISSEEYIGVIGKGIKNTDKFLASHEDLRAEFLNSDGTYKEMTEQLDLFITKYNEMPDSTDKARFAMDAFGRSFTTAIPILQKVKQAKEDNRAVLKDMGLDYADVETKTKAYLKAERDLKVVHEAQAVQVGSVLLPLWTSFRSSMAGMAANEMPMITTSFQILATVLVGIIGIVTMLFDFLKVIINSIVNILVPIVQGAVQFIEGDWKGAWKTIKEGGIDTWDQLNKDGEAFLAKINKIGDSLAEIWNPKKSNVSTEVTTPTTVAGGGDTESALARVQAALEKKKAIYEMSGLYELDENGKILNKKAEQDQVFRTFTKQMEADFLEAELKKFDGTTKDKAKLQKMFFEAERSGIDELYKAKIAKYDADIKLEKKSIDNAINMAIQKRNIILGKSDGVKNADWEKANEEVKALEKKKDDLERDVASIREKATEEADLAKQDIRIREIQHSIEMGNTAELKGLQQIQVIEDRKYGILKAALQKRLALKELEGDEGKKEATTLRAELERIDRDAANKKIDTERKTQLIVKAGWQGVFGSIKQELNKSLQGMILGTTTLKQAMSNIWGSMKSQFAQMAADQLMIWVGLEKSKTAATSESALERLAIETWASIKKVAIYIWEGIKYVAIQAWKAAASAYNSIAAIPVVGPFLAPAAAALALLAVLKMATSIASARKGFDIAAGDNPVTQLHEKEMVLPAEHAETIRGMKGLYTAMAQSKYSANKYDKTQYASGDRVTNSTGHTFNITTALGDTRELAKTIKKVLNNDSRIYGSA